MKLPLIPRHHWATFRPMIEMATSVHRALNFVHFTRVQADHAEYAKANRAVSVGGLTTCLGTIVAALKVGPISFMAGLAIFLATVALPFWAARALMTDVLVDVSEAYKRYRSSRRPQYRPSIGDAICVYGLYGAILFLLCSSSLILGAVFLVSSVAAILWYYKRIGIIAEWYWADGKKNDTGNE